MIVMRDHTFIPWCPPTPLFSIYIFKMKVSLAFNCPLLFSNPVQNGHMGPSPFLLRFLFFLEISRLRNYDYFSFPATTRTHKTLGEWVTNPQFLKRVKIWSFVPVPFFAYCPCTECQFSSLFYYVFLFSKSSSFCISNILVSSKVSKPPFFPPPSEFPSPQLRPPLLFALIRPHYPTHFSFFFSLTARG